METMTVIPRVQGTILIDCHVVVWSRINMPSSFSLESVAIELVAFVKLSPNKQLSRHAPGVRLSSTVSAERRQSYRYGRRGKTATIIAAMLPMIPVVVSYLLLDTAPVRG